MLKIIPRQRQRHPPAYKRILTNTCRIGRGHCLRAGTKAQEADLSDEMKNPYRDARAIGHCAEKRGYSGGRCRANAQPDSVLIGIGYWRIRQGRAVCALRFRQAIGDLALSAQRHQRAGAAGIEIPLFRRVLSFAWSHEGGGADIVVWRRRNIAHQKHRPENRKGNQKTRLPSRGARMDRQSHPYAWLDGYVAHALLSRQPWLHLVEQTADRRRKMSVAHRLSGWLRPNSPPKRCPRMFIKMKFSDHAPLVVESTTMLPNQVFGKYDWMWTVKPGIGAAWVVAAFVPAYAGVDDIHAGADARLGWNDRANPLWAVVWLLFTTRPHDSAMFRLEAGGWLPPSWFASPPVPFWGPRRALWLPLRSTICPTGRLKCELSNSKT